MSRRKRMTFVHGCFAVFLALHTDDAAASLDVGASVADLARWSSAVAVVTALDSNSVWEGTRIVTYSRVRVDELVAGRIATAEPTVKTFGGAVGTIAQVVGGEAELAPGTRWMLFLRESPDGTSSITARAQGQFAMTEKTASQWVLAPSPHLGHLVDPRGVPAQRTAVAALQGLSLESAEQAILVAWGETHAP
jgi:hypothetical protein